MTHIMNNAATTKLGWLLTYQDGTEVSPARYATRRDAALALSAHEQDWRAKPAFVTRESRREDEQRGEDAS